MGITEGLKQLDRLLEAHGFGPCTHPDCGADGMCATSYISRRAKALALACITVGKKLELAKRKAAKSR